MAHLFTSSTTLEVGTPPPSTTRSSFNVLFHRFVDLSAERGQYVHSPEFEYNGRKWRLIVYPGGDSAASEGFVSVYLQLRSGESCEVDFDIFFQSGATGMKVSEKKTKYVFELPGSWGWRDFTKRSKILDNGSLLDLNGTLAVVMSMTMKEERLSVQPFVPKNIFSDLMKGLLFDEDTADVCFEVGTNEVDEGNTVFHAHRLVLKKCTPMLSALFDSSNTLEGDEKMARAVITDVKPEVFRLLLANVYGRSMAEDDMKTHVKDIIDAADKYSIVNLKLGAEAAYVKSTKITVENAMDNLLYADALNLALLKEVVMDFLAENHDEAVKKVSFADVPGHLMKDLLVAFGMSKKEGKGNEKEEDFDVMRVSELRVKLDKMGLDVDGSREAMIEALHKSSKQS